MQTTITGEHDAAVTLQCDSCSAEHTFVGISIAPPTARVVTPGEPEQAIAFESAACVARFYAERAGWVYDFEVDLDDLDAVPVDLDFCPGCA